MARLRLWGAAAALVLGLPLAGWAQGPRDPAAPEAQRRVALVIGNDGYESSPLANSINDARAMAGVLREAGFAVTLLTDVDQRQFQLALREFGERLKASGSGGAGLFYYAGHGVQIKGRNFLIPVRSQIEHEDEVAYSAVDAQSVLDKMESAGNGTNIVILDACRNNPYTRSVRSSQQGLAQMDAPVGTLVAYATAPGSVAVDSRPGLRNGLYTTHLLEAVRQRGLKVEDVFKQVRGAVLRASGNRQQPWESTALVGDFYFHPPPPGPFSAPPAVAEAPADRQAALDDALWEAVKTSTNAAELLAYLNRFSGGRHAREARRRLAELTSSAAGSWQFSSMLGTPPGDPEALARLRATSARVAAELAASVAAGRQPGEVQATWGEAGAGARTATGRRNEHGFSEGDRFRYQVTDLRATPTVRSYFWRVDRVEPDGSLWINEGRQRLDPQGQRRSGNDEAHGTWLDFDPPLPLAQAAGQDPGAQGAVSTVVNERDAEGRLTRFELDGQWRTSVAEVQGPRHLAGSLTALLVEFELAGSSLRGDGSRQLVRWMHRFWLVRELRLPVRIMVEEMTDGMMTRRALHELVAVDVL